MTTRRSRHHDHIVAQIAPRIPPPHSPTTPAHQLKPSPQRHPPPSRCDQDITSPICLIDDKARNPTTHLIHHRPCTFSRQSVASDDTWLTSSVSVTSRRVGDTSATPLPCASTKSQGNTNYVPRHTTMSPDPTDIDKCTELEAMKQGLARIQAGHARPSDFLPQHNTTNVDPYIRRTLDEIRRSINEISTDAALQQEVQQLRESVKRLSLCHATTDTAPNAPNKSEAQLAGLLQDIRASLRATAVCEPGGECNAASEEGGIMKALDEIRQSVHELQAAVDEAIVETEPVVHPTHDNPAVMLAINDIRQSLHDLRDGVSNVEQDNTNEHEDGAIMQALNEIRQSVNVLVQGAEEGAVTEEPANDILQALTEIRNSVRVLAGEEEEGGDTDDGKGNEAKHKGDAAIEMAACAMVRSMEGLQKTVEKISDQLLTSRSEGTWRSSERKEKRRRRRKVGKGKSKASSESELDEEDIAHCIKECCKDSCKFGSTCDKLIRFLISQNCNSPRPAAPSLHYLVPPQAQPPKFIAPFCRMPRPMPPPPPASMALPPPPMPNYPQTSAGPHLPRPAQPLHQPPFTYPNNLCGVPHFSPPYSPPMSCPQYQFQQPPPTTGTVGQRQSVPHSAPSVFNQCSNFAPQPACFQPETNAAVAPSSDACNQDSAPPPPQQQQQQHQQPPTSRHSSSKPNCEQDQPVVFTATVNDQPLAFTLTFAGTTDAGAQCNSFPNYANRTFLCTQIEQ